MPLLQWYYGSAMYVRAKTFKNKNGSQRTYLQIVQTERAGKSVRQRVIANLGRLDEMQTGPIDNLIASLARFSKREWVRKEALAIEARSAKSWGAALVFERLWRELGLKQSVEALLCRGSYEADYAEAIFAMVLNRLCEPASKLRVSDWIRSVYRPGWERLELQHFYRALDLLEGHKDEIEMALYARLCDLFDLKLDLVLWDTTSTYFEGDQAGMGEYGFSKDRRPDRLQVVVGVLMSRYGLPIAHEVFPGSTADVDTFGKALEVMKQRYQVSRVILVADRGMVSKKVLCEIEAAGLEYIVGVRMRRSSVAQDVLSQVKQYTEIAENLKVAEVDRDGLRYIVCLNPEQQERDSALRQQLLSSLRHRIESGDARSLIGNKGYKRYLKVESSSLQIDEARAEREAMYDGLYMLVTNSGLSAAEAAIAYKSLWQVERAFRELKTGLELRPVYHYAERRIRGHIMVCFLALVLEMVMRCKLRQHGEDAIRWEDMMQSLQEIRAVEIAVGDKRYLARTEAGTLAMQAFSALGMRPPERVREMAPSTGADGQECSGTRQPLLFPGQHGWPFA